MFPDALLHAHLMLHRSKPAMSCSCLNSSENRIGQGGPILALVFLTPALDSNIFDHIQTNMYAFARFQLAVLGLPAELLICFRFRRSRPTFIRVHHLVALHVCGTLILFVAASPRHFPCRCLLKPFFSSTIT